jgi:uncharacterized MAPEG superfamily protein
MPIIFYVLLASSILPIIIAGIAVHFRKKEFGHADNNHPRIQQSKLTGIGARTMAAQQNAWEALPVFISVVLIAYACGVDLNSLDLSALIFITFRVLHAIFYILHLASLRSLSFAVSFFSCLYIFYVAATVHS